MTEQSGQQYTYYAFISYSRRDEKWARWLQRRLETYRLPVAVRKARLGIPKRIAPVFRDKTDLASGALEDALERELDASRFLIVLCSPAAAASPWVNKEVSRFIQAGREENIIPLILEGEPHAADETQECFPPALREEVSKELLGISVPEAGKTPAFLRVAAAMLGIRYDELAMRHKRRQRRNRLLAGIGAAVCLAAAGWAVWWNTPHSAYYADYITRWEVPEGLGPLSREQRAGRESAWRIVTLRGRVVRLERVNSAGTPVDTLTYLLSDEYPVTAFTYDDKGQLSQAEVRGADSQLIQRQYYSYNPAENQIAIDLRRPGNGSEALTALADLTAGYADEQDDTHSEITRMLNTYDESGLLLESRYQQDARSGSAVCDANGIYGMRYKHDGEGRVVQVDYLNAQDQPHRSASGVAAVTYERDELGQITRIAYLDEHGGPAVPDGGLSQFAIEYDTLGNLTALQKLDADGQPCCDEEHSSRIELTYDERGFAVSYISLDNEGAPAYDGETGYYELRMEYDQAGHCVREAYYDAHGQPMYSTEGYSSSTTVFDEQGRILELRYYGPDGSPAHIIESGVCGVRYTYDENGYRASTTLLDENGEPWADSPEEYSPITRYQNDSSGNVTARYYLKADGTPEDGTAAAMYSYDSNGNVRSVMYYDKNGALYEGSDGSACIMYTYSNGRKDTVTYLDAEGQPSDTYGYSGYSIQYDEHGSPTAYGYFGPDGELTTEGYAMRVLTRDEYGRVLTITYYDADMEPTEVSGTTGRYYQKVLEYDDQGNLISNLFLTLSEEDDDDYAGFRVVYDERHNIVLDTFLNERGEPWENKDGVCSLAYTYNEKNQLIRGEALNAQGEPATQSDQPAWEEEYDERGRLALTRYYVLENGVETLDRQVACTYDERGSLIREQDLDAEGNPLEQLPRVYRTPDGIGIQRGDYVLTWNDWNYFSFDYSIAAIDSFADITAEDAAPLHILLARENEEGGYTFLDYALEECPDGLHIRRDMVSPEEADALRAAYEAWEPEAGKEPS